MTIDRTKAIQAAEAAYQQELDRAAKFRIWLCAHLGRPPGTVCPEAEAIIRCNDGQELTDEQLELVVIFDLGLPPGYSYSEQQIAMAIKQSQLQG